MMLDEEEARAIIRRHIAEYCATYITAGYCTECGAFMTQREPCPPLCLACIGKLCREMDADSFRDLEGFRWTMVREITIKMAQ